FVSGTWTYIGTGTPPQAPGKSTLWEKLVIDQSGTIDMYSAFPGDQDWGKPTTERFKIVPGNYKDSGQRVFAIQVADYDMKVVLTNEGTLREISAARDVEFLRGDASPFAK